MTGGVTTGRGCALARCPRRATTTIRACGVVHLCEPCRELVEGLAVDATRELAGVLALAIVVVLALYLAI